jgi:rhodanese-related sulfurtransferase
MKTTYSKRKAINHFEAKLAFTAGPTDVNDMLKDREEVNIVDVRRPEDYRRGHIPHAINVPREEWSTLLGLDRSRTNIVYCYSQQCHLATRACLEFARKGFRVVELEGGFKAWQEYEYEVETEEGVRKAA